MFKCLRFRNELFGFRIQDLGLKGVRAKDLGFRVRSRQAFLDEKQIADGYCLRPTCLDYSGFIRV